MQDHGIERRRAPRVQASFPLQLSTRAEAAPATLKDISTNGLCCAFGEAVPEMTMVRLDLQFPGERETHRIDGIVVRCDKRRRESPPSYDIAIYFAELGEAARASVEAYVAKTL